MDKLVPKGRDGEEVIWRMGLPKKGNGGSKGMEVRMLGEWEGVEERLLCKDGVGARSTVTVGPDSEGRAEREKGLCTEC